MSVDKSKADKAAEALHTKITPADEESIKDKFLGKFREFTASQGILGLTPVPLGGGLVDSLFDSLKTLWAMLTDKDYVITWDTKKWILVALGYFASPIDLIPDFIPGIGYVDDAMVVAYVVHKISEEIVRYRAARNIQ